MQSKDILSENSQRLLNPHIQGSKRSITHSLNQFTMELESQGKKIYHYDLDESPFSVPENVLKKLAEHGKKNDYLAIKGLKELRHQIAQWMNRSEKLSFTQDDILVGSGSKELLFLIGLCMNCEEVMVSPSWVSHVPKKQFFGGKIQVIHSKFENRWRLLPSELDELCSKDISDPEHKNKYLIISYPDNPTGLTYKPDQLQELAKVARKHNLLVISDQIYGKLRFNDQHQSIAKYYPQGTIICSEISKWAGARGWRLGFLAFPKELRWLLEQFCNVLSETLNLVGAAIQHTSCTAFQEAEGEEITKYLEAQRSILNKIGNWCFEKLTKECHLLSHPPEGGFSIFLDFEKYREKLLQKGIKTSKEFAKILLEEIGVAVLPGEVFGRVESQLTIRLSFVNFDGSEALKAYNEGVEVNEAFLKKYCAETVEGIEALAKWLNDLTI